MQTGSTVRIFRFLRFGCSYLKQRQLVPFHGTPILPGFAALPVGETRHYGGPQVDRVLPHSPGGHSVKSDHELSGIITSLQSVRLSKGPLVRGLRNVSTQPSDPLRSAARSEE